MNTQQILEIEDLYPKTVNFILQGLFIKVHNRSFYIVTELLGKKLIPTCSYVKSANNRFVIKGGFPAKQFMQLFPDAVFTEWGYQLVGDFNLAAYEVWLANWESRLAS